MFKLFFSKKFLSAVLLIGIGASPHTYAKHDKKGFSLFADTTLTNNLEICATWELFTRLAGEVACAQMLNSWSDLPPEKAEEAKKILKEFCGASDADLEKLQFKTHGILHNISPMINDYNHTISFLHDSPEATLEDKWSQFILAHEYGHIKFGKLRRILRWFAGVAGSYGIASGIRYTCRRAFGTEGWKAKIATAFISTTIYNLSRFAAVILDEQFQEKDADLFATQCLKNENDIQEFASGIMQWDVEHVLNRMIGDYYFTKNIQKINPYFFINVAFLFKSYGQNEILQTKGLDFGTWVKSENPKMYNFLKLTFDPIHPLPEKRIAYVTEHARKKLA